MNFFIDSYAWIEYLEGSEKGAKVRKILISKNNVYTLSLNVAEVVSRVKRKGGDANLASKAIMMNSKVINVSLETAKEAGLFHAEIRKKIRDFGLVDALILLSARKVKAKILTGDKHFKSFKDAVLI